MASRVLLARSPADQVALLIRLKPAVMGEPTMPESPTRSDESPAATEGEERLILTPAGVLHPRWQRDKAGEGLWVACKRDVVERLTGKKGELLAVVLAAVDFTMAAPDC